MASNSLPWAEYVREPRVYGFHATLKAPFYLSVGSSEADLKDAAREFAANCAAVTIGQLVVRELGTFIALVPGARSPLVDRLAQACVKEFDRFRAPMSESEHERRLAANLTTRQIENLERWGYPYVAEDFRFHMTLTGSLALPERNQALRFLCDRFEQVRGANPSHRQPDSRSAPSRRRCAFPGYPSRDIGPFRVPPICLHVLRRRRSDLWTTGMARGSAVDAIARFPRRGATFLSRVGDRDHDVEFIDPSSRSHEPAVASHVETRGRLDELVCCRPLFRHSALSPNQSGDRGRGGQAL